MPAVRKRAGHLVLVSDGRTDTLQVPRGFDDLDTFRGWARSDTFPERGRIDYIEGEVEVDMSPEDLETDGTPKADISADLVNEVRSRDLGRLWIDRARLSNNEARLSVEPDIVLLLWETLESGRARRIPKAGKEHGRYVELEGMADLIVEVVSDPSEKKDTQRLRDRYFRAGVREYWIVDARGAELSFTVLHWITTGYKAARPDRQGFVRSRVLERSVRLKRSPARMGTMTYRLEIRPER